MNCILSQATEQQNAFSIVLISTILGTAIMAGAATIYFKSNQTIKENAHGLFGFICVIFAFLGFILIAYGVGVIQFINQN